MPVFTGMTDLRWLARDGIDRPFASCFSHDYFPARVAFQLLLDLASPSIELPLTRPEYSTPPALNVIWSPLSLPLAIAALLLPDFSVPDSI